MSTQHILLTTDLSEESTRAFAPAADLARKIGARVTLFHVVPDMLAVPYGAPLAPPPSLPDLSDQLEAAKARLTEFRELLGADIEVDVEVRSGERIARVVTDYAEEHGIGYIAMATHGRSGLRRMVMGSVAEAVLRQSVTPIILYPRPV